MVKACVRESDSAFVFWMSRVCTAKRKPLHGSLFVIVAEEADVLDLLSPFPSQSVFRIRLIERSLPPSPPPRDGRVSRAIATLAPGPDVLPV